MLELDVTSDDPSQVTVSCSEIHDYFYCPHAWWHSDSAPTPEGREALRRGEEHHAKFAKAQSAASRGKYRWVLLAGAILLAATAIVLLLAGHAR